MAHATIEDKTVVMDRLMKLGIKEVIVDDYDELRERLDLIDWSNTRLKRVTGSLYHNDRCIKISRVGEPMRDQYRPFRFIVAGVLKLAA